MYPSERFFPFAATVLNFLHRMHATEYFLPLFNSHRYMYSLCYDGSSWERWWSDFSSAFCALGLASLLTIQLIFICCFGWKHWWKVELSFCSLKEIFCKYCVLNRMTLWPCLCCDWWSQNTRDSIRCRFILIQIELSPSTIYIWTEFELCLYFKIALKS